MLEQHRDGRESGADLKKRFVEKQPILVNTGPWSADAPILQSTLEAGKKSYSISQNKISIKGVSLQQITAGW
jgi:hypothetical protein